MNLIKIDETNRHELEIYHKLRENAFTEDNSFIADSPKVVNILLQTDIHVKSILATSEYYEEFSELISKKDIPKLFVIDKKEMESIVGHKIHHNCMMHGIRPQETPLENLGDNIIMLDDITSTENVGSIARSAAALGVNSYLLPRYAPHPYARRALRVSMGHIVKLHVHIYDDIFSTLEALKANGYRIFAAEVTENSKSLMSVGVPQKWVLLMGHEGKGLSQEVIDMCDEVVEIEMMDDVRSLNVGVAASIMMHRFKNIV
ncbi:MAG: RNA methyltransferase [Sulfurimonas sp.]|uniref:TrmH family RNA methyltransferase n=1 Tax=Sulfurimonas sp. TaxID=2022749 RepID=UPI002635815D|nr:RNA methyltransferase [Sulfurimonas sp.]MCW8894627.1 RNA methyltransferase [Sulfurimonas sp.]MCW8955072.1 RNA methyltransferase [Sulfurimonas sp.]MCW9066808.1 RNA methyltransferase [Sulfurimonas sp.]